MTGTQLSRARRQLGLTRKALAALAGVTASRIASMEARRTKLRETALLDKVVWTLELAGVSWLEAA